MSKIQNISPFLNWRWVFVKFHSIYKGLGGTRNTVGGSVLEVLTHSQVWLVHIILGVQIDDFISWEPKISGNLPGPHLFKFILLHSQWLNKLYIVKTKLYIVFKQIWSIVFKIWNDLGHLVTMQMVRQHKRYKSNIKPWDISKPWFLRSQRSIE